MVVGAAGFLGVRSRWDRVEGEGIELAVPVLLLRDGELDEEALRVEHLPMDEVMEQPRQSGILDLSTVRYAVLEPNGSISFIPEEVMAGVPPGAGW